MQFLRIPEMEQVHTALDVREKTSGDTDHRRSFTFSDTHKHDGEVYLDSQFTTICIFCPFSQKLPVSLAVYPHCIPLAPG